MFCSRTQIWIGPCFCALVFGAAGLQAEGFAFASRPTGSTLSFEGDPVPGPVGNLAGFDRFGTDSRTGPGEPAQFPTRFAAGLIEQHLRAERDVQARELAFQELDAIQLSTEFEFEQTDRLLTAPPLEERRSSGLLLATSPHAAQIGTGPGVRAIPAPRNTHWTGATQSRTIPERQEWNAAPRVPRPVPLHSHTNYFSIRNGYIRKRAGANVTLPAPRIALRSFPVSTFSISHDSIPDHGSRIHQSSTPTVNSPRDFKFAQGGRAASGQKNDQVPA